MGRGDRLTRQGPALRALLAQKRDEQKSGKCTADLEIPTVPCGEGMTAGVGLSARTGVRGQGLRRESEHVYSRRGCCKMQMGPLFKGRV